MSDDLFHDPFDPDADPASGQPAAVFPWPPEAGASLIEALVATGSACLMAPARFFAAMPPDRSTGPAFLFLVVVAYAGAGAALFWDMVLPAPAWIPAELRSSGTEAVTGFLVSGPVALAFTVLFALCVQAGLVVFGARGARIGNTVAVLCYASVTSILQVIPWLGAILGAVWGIVITIVGVREVHGATTGRAAAAVLLPIVAVAMVVSVLVAVVIVAGLSSGLLSR